MSSVSVKSLHIYPVKSAAGIALSNSWVDDFGLSFDRRFVVSDLNGQFITARTEPTLCLITINLTQKGLILTAANMPALHISYQKLSTSYQPVAVWDDKIQAQHGHEDYDLWISHYLQKPCQLLYFGEQSQRKVHNSQNQVAFADGYPLLLIAQASLDDLNSRLPANASNGISNQISMTQFRPNIVVDDCTAFAEDSWQHIRIGEVEFEVKKPCSRCIFTTINPENAEKHPQLEPLNTLKNYRQVSNGDVMFGQNLIALNQGAIKQGDKVVVLNKQTPQVFKTKVEAKVEAKPVLEPTFKTTEKTTLKPSNQQPVANNENIEGSKQSMASSKVKLDFNSWNKKVLGNTKDSILEQGEAAGLLLPYSCRGGMCGRCKIKLESGDVKQVATDGLSDDDKAKGFVLACSSIPLSDIVLAKR